MQLSFRPRRLELNALVGTLVKEHGIMKEGLRRAKDAARRGDFETVGRTLRELDPVFRQHIADEEASILGLLIAVLGAKGAEAEILVFRQHRPIYQLMEKVAEFAKKPVVELQGSQVELEALFEEHTRAEEERVFPKALTLNSGRAGAG